jgi:hypothetical protein
MEKKTTLKKKKIPKRGHEILNFKKINHYYCELQMYVTKIVAFLKSIKNRPPFPHPTQIERFSI